MGEGENEHVIGFLDVDDRVGKAVAEVPANVCPENPGHARVLANFLNEPIHLGGESSGQGPALAFVVFGSREQIRLRLRMELEGLHDP